MFCLLRGHTKTGLLKDTIDGAEELLILMSSLYNDNRRDVAAAQAGFMSLLCLEAPLFHESPSLKLLVLPTNDGPGEKSTLLHTCY